MSKYINKCPKIGQKFKVDSWANVQLGFNNPIEIEVISKKISEQTEKVYFQTGIKEIYIVKEGKGAYYLHLASHHYSCITQEHRNGIGTMLVFV